MGRGIYLGAKVQSGESVHTFLVRGGDDNPTTYRVRLPPDFISDNAIFNSRFWRYDVPKNEKGLANKVLEEHKL